MRPANFLLAFLVLALSYPTLILAQTTPTSGDVNPGDNPMKGLYVAQRRVKGTMPKSTVKATAKPAQLPPQPVCTTVALPDIMVEKIELQGPSGPLKPGQKYSVVVRLRNIGQCETGVFLVQLQVRVQVPSMRKDDTQTVGAKKVYSIPPSKTGSAGSSTVSFQYTLGNYDWAQYNFTAVADYTNHIREFDEANNEQYGRDEVADAHRQ